MNRKGPSSVDHPSAPPATTRRGLFGAAGAAGVLGIGAALLAGSDASASPNAPTDDDTPLLEQAMVLELTARDLYREAADSASDPEVVSLAEQLGRNHGEYAKRIAGSTGLSARVRDEETYDRLLADFTSGDLTSVAEAAYELEQIAVATHTDLLTRYESTSAVSLTASILVVESRHAAVLADVAGRGDDLDALLVNTAEPLDLGGAA